MSEPEQANLPKEETGYRGLHPIAAFFHIIFKGAAILVFLLKVIGIFSSFVGVFISVTLLLAADFWTVKNVSGRLLVGLRWWNEVKEDGTNVWTFESGVDTSLVNAFDSTFFWTTTFGNVVVWGVFAFFSITSFSSLPLCILALILGGANALGYIKCRKDARKKVTNFLVGQAAKNPGMAKAALKSAV